MHAFFRISMTAVLLGGSIYAADLGNAPVRKISLGMYLDLVNVSDPQISPDGKQIIFTRRWVDKMNDRFESALYIMDADGGRQRFLVKGSGARWSPDGTRIAYLAQGEPKGNQIYVRWMDAEGAVTEITRLEESPAGISWSPDSKSIAFSKLVPQRESWNIHLPARPEGAKWTPDPVIIDRLRYRADRQGILPVGFRHIFIVSADGGAPRQLTDGDFNDGGGFGGNGLSWTPDGRQIVFSGLRIPDADYHVKENYIYAVDTSNGAVRQLVARKGENQNPIISPNGRYVAYTGYDFVMQAWKASDLYVMNIDGSNQRDITPKLDRTPTGLMWSANSSGLYFGVSESGTRNLYYASLDSEVRKVTDGTHMLTVTSTTKSGMAAGVLTDSYNPGDIVAFDVTNPHPKQLTAVNADLLHGIKLGDVEEFSYTSLDNMKIQGWIVKPPDFDPSKKYPLILSIHGGPAGMYDVGFNFAYQDHAANGYVVVYTNPRGSTGYGTDFGNAINYDYPGKDFNDLMKGVDSVVSRGYIDERNLFVYGCSGGGVLTSWTVGHTDRFAAAVAQCPVTDWLSFAGIVDAQPNYYSLFFKKLPWEDPTEYLKHSSVMYAGNVKTPTLLMTGVLDMRTPMPQSEEFYEALKLRGVPTALIRMNGEYHGTTSIPSNFMRTQLYLRYWFDKYKRK
ncbi:MAG TPA: S9 family peptidase [Bryobacteraceae bacterium]|nr:S9 family peptidase [Bryobacteraceae bacterium]